MEQVILVVSPLIVSLLTYYVKNLKTVNVLAGSYRSTLLRFIVALLSFGAVIGGSMLNGTPVDAVSVDTFSQTLITFLAASGTYFFVKK